MPKMHSNTFGGRAPPESLGSLAPGDLKHSPGLLAAIKGVLLLRGGFMAQERMMLVICPSFAC